MINIKPFGKNILVRPTAKTTVLTVDQGTLCEYGAVLAVGDEVTKIKVGDEIGFLVWGVQKLEIEGETFYFVPESTDFILSLIER